MDYLEMKALRHSDDELMHWKYIKRYRADGKWRYVYASKDTHHDIKTYQRAANNATKLGDKRQDELSGYEEFLNRAANGDADKEQRLREGSKRSLDIIAGVRDLHYADAESLNNDAKKLIEKNSVKTVVNGNVSDAKKFIKKVVGRR